MTSPDLTSGPSRLWRRTPSKPRRIHIDGSCFEWIESTASPEFDDIRERIESLWRRIPAQHRPEFEARLRSKSLTDFHSAYNELWYFSALESGGLRCLPAGTTSAGSLPDWHLASGDLQLAVAECYLRMQPEEEVRNDAVQRRWFDETFRRLENKKIRLSIHDRTCGKGMPSSQRFAKHLDALAPSSSITGEAGSLCSLGRYQYQDYRSGWSLDFTLFIRQSVNPDSVAQLIQSQFHGVAWCQGERLFDEALSRKSRQHTEDWPVVICVGWNYFAHKPDFEDVCNVVREKASSFESRSVCGVFWATEVYPWNAAPAAPRLIHWDSCDVAPLLACWTGQAVDVSGRQPD